MSDVNVIALVKTRGGVQERYIFLYDDAAVEDVRAKLGKFAADPSLSFTWYDAATVSAKMKNAQCKVQNEIRTRSRDSSEGECRGR